MLLQILQRTPLWVFALFAVLVVTLAIRPELAATWWLPVGVSFAYGLMSGAFLARALRIFGARRTVVHP